MRRNQHAEFVTLNDDDALELFKATLPSTSLMQVQRGTAVLAKRELENLIGQAAQGLYSGETRHESRGNDVDWMKHTHCPAWSPSMWRYGDPDADLKSLVLRSKTPRASGGLELLSFEPGEPEVEPGDGAVGTPLGLDRSDSSRSMTPLDDEAELMDSRLLTLAAQVESNREVEGLQTRPGEEQSVGTRQDVRAPRNGGCCL